MQEEQAPPPPGPKSRRQWQLRGPVGGSRERVRVEGGEVQVVWYVWTGHVHVGGPSSGLLVIEGRRSGEEEIEEKEEPEGRGGI